MPVVEERILPLAAEPEAVDDLGPRPADNWQDPPPPPPAPQAPAPVQVPADPVVTERWAFRSRTVQRIVVAGIMFVIAKRFADLQPFIDQQMIVDAVKMVFDLFGLGYLAAAGRARQLAGPERLYWIPRLREAQQPPAPGTSQ